MPAIKAAQICFLIVRKDTAAMFFNQQLGRNYGHPQGAWGPDPSTATRFKTEKEAQDRIDHLGLMAAYAEVVPYTPGQPETNFGEQVHGPRYRLTEQAYINDVLLAVGAEITYFGVPGRHMQPINAAAQVEFEKAYPLGTDPLQDLTDALAHASLSSLDT